MSSRALVVHATDLLAKGFVAVSPDRGRGGATNGLYGVTRVVREVLGFKAPEVAVAVVGPLPAEAPPGLVEQHGELEELLVAHGLPVVRSDEAIQVVASYVVAALRDGRDVIVAGSDKRLAQLVSKRVWWFDGYKRMRYTTEAVEKRFGVGPDEVAGWLALVGDRDTCVGIRGIGAKGAVDLIAAHGSVRAALDAAESVEGRTGKALRAGRDEAYRQLAHAVLQTDAPLPRAWEELPWAEPEVAALDALYQRLGFFRLLSGHGERVLRWRLVAGRELADVLDAHRSDVALVPVITDPSPPRGRLVGLALSPGEGEAFYVPLGRGVPVPLVAWLEDPAVTKTGHDTKTARVALARLGVELRGVVGDACLASHLLEPSGLAPHDLGPTAQTVLHRAVRHEDEVRGRGAKRRDFDQLPVEVVGEFACHLAETSGILWRHFEGSVDPAQLAASFELAETLVRMELRGMAVDVTVLEGTARYWEAERAELEATIYEHAGRPFGIGSTKQLGEVLFRELELPVVMRTKTGWSTRNAALERIQDRHPIVPLVLRWRLLKRLQDTWITALTACIEDDGRVRSTFSPSRSFTGRLVNFAPDLGRVPGRTEDMNRIRHAFRAPAGRRIVSVDYHQLGLHVLAHLSRDPALVEPLSRGADMHRETASALFDLPPEAIDYDQRQVAKVVNFATFAGQGASALALQLEVDIAEAKELIRRFDERYHVTRTYQEGELDLARNRGWIETLAGRRWPIHDLEARDPMTRQYAERLARRATHEASVADVGRLGLVRAERALRAAGIDGFPLVVVLDEVLFEVAEEQVEAAAERTAAAMRSVFELVVPLSVGCKAGPSWGELEVLGS